MKLNKLLFTAVSLFFFGTAVRAQFDMPKTDKVIDMKNRQLVVIINPPDPDVANKYNRKGRTAIMQEYEQMFGNYNEEMKYIVPKFWNFNSKEILFKTWAELDEMTHDKSQRDKYVVMYCFSNENHKGFDWKINNSGERIVGTFSYFTVGFPDENPLTHFNFQFTNLIPSVKELTFLISTVNSEFNYIVSHKDKPDMEQMLQENKHILCNKTLLLVKSTVIPDMAKDIPIYYPNKCRLVEDSVMEEAMLLGDTSCAYVIPFGNLHNRNMNWIVNCADGAVLGYTTKGSLLVGSMFDKGLTKAFFIGVASMCGTAAKK